MGIGLRFGAGPLRVYIPLTGGRRKRRRKSKYWTHTGCTIRHRTQNAANRCKAGRVASYTPVSPAPTATATPKQKIAVGALFVVVAAGLYAVGTHETTSSRTQNISRSTYAGGGVWPLTVDSGVLSCPHGTVLFTTGSTAYAQYPIAGDGHSNIDQITAADPTVPSLKLSVFDLFEEGQALCG